MKTIIVLLALSSALLYSQTASPSVSQHSQPTTWNFALSGDSRNCGDVVMPAIAQGAKAAGAEFYWELGDFRALYDFDQDMQGELRDGKPRKLTITDYLNQAWDDFIRNQANAFAMPVFLGIGNHELYGGKTRADYIAQFGDWISNDWVRKQRLADDPNRWRGGSGCGRLRGGGDLRVALGELLPIGRPAALDDSLSCDALAPQLLLTGCKRPQTRVGRGGCLRRPRMRGDERPGQSANQVPCGGSHDVLSATLLPIT